MNEVLTHRHNVFYVFFIQGYETEGRMVFGGRYGGAIVNFTILLVILEFGGAEGGRLSVLAWPGLAWLGLA